MRKEPFFSGLARTGVLGVFLIGASLAGAQDISDQAEGMGKAGVGLVEGSSAFLRNPALATLDDEDFEYFTGEWGIRGFFGANIRAGGDLLSTVDSINSLFQGLQFEEIQSRLNASRPEATVGDLENTMNLIQSIVELGSGEQGIIGSVGGGFHLKIGSFAVYARQVGHTGISPILDLSIPGASALTSSELANLFGNSTGGALSPAGSSLASQLKNAGLTGDSDLDGFDDAEELAFHAQQALGEDAISNPTFVSALESIVQATNSVAGTGSSSSTLAFNNSGVELRGITIREVGLSASYPLIPGFLSIGVTVKELTGETFRTHVGLAQLEEGNELLTELFENFSENTKKTSRMSADLGISIRPLPFLTVGIVGRNLLPAEFDYSGSSDSFQLNPQVRLGVGISALGFLRIGLDVDLLEMDLDSLVDGLKSRYLGGGVEFDLGGDLFGFKIRAGGFTDVAANDVAPVWSMGLGIKVLGFFLDVNAQMALSETEVETSGSQNGISAFRLPEQVSATMALGFEVSF